MKREKKIKVWIFLFCHHVVHNFFYCIVQELFFAIWNICIVRNPEIAESQNYEWTAEGKIQWDEGILPRNIKEILQ